MNDRVTAALALFFTVSGAWVNGQLKEPVTLPQLRVSQMNGEMQVETPGHMENVTGQSLPYVRPGSVVRIQSGTVDFESNYHATIRAWTGAHFLVTAVLPAKNRPGELRIGVIGGRPAAMDVNIGGERFLLGNQGAVLSISPAGYRGMTVKAVSGHVEIIPGSATKEGESVNYGAFPQDGVAMEPGTKTVVKVPPRPQFEKAALRRSFITITRKSPTVFEAKAIFPRRSDWFKREKSAHKAIGNWPSLSQKTARLMMEQYGPPNKITAKSLIWNNNGPWNKTIVYREGEFHAFPYAHADVLRQFINYDVPREKIGALASLDLGLDADRVSQELSAVSESEESNFLALNLANDVVTDKRDVNQARQNFTKTVELANSGKFSPAMRQLLFNLP